MTERRLRAFIAAIVFCVAPALFARVVSYAPYSNSVSFAGVQSRLDRYFAVVEGPNPAYFGGPSLTSPLPYWGNYAYGQVVLYDFQGREEPRVIFPKDGSLAAFSVLAVRENAQHVPSILIQTNSTLGGQNPSQQFLMMLSTDGGATWKHVLFGNDVIFQLPNQTPDLGGPFARSRYSQVRMGTDDTPFIAGTFNAVYGITTDAYARPVASIGQVLSLIGTNRDGSLFLARNAQDRINVGYTSGISPAVVRPSINVNPAAAYEGWIADDGSVYLEQYLNNQRSLLRDVNGVTTTIAGPDGASADAMSFFAIPTNDYNGAWMIQRGTGKPTKLLRYTPAEGVREQWQDVTGPQVEALIAGSSGTSLLIQVHRERPQADQRLFKDPALAVWHVGEPAPSNYDELYLNETQSKGFVHIDVDKIASGEPFVFDSGPPGNGSVLRVSPVPAGGSDVTQEWGVVRASLKQTLVLPGVGRIQGAYGSFWYSDVVLYNPMAKSQNVLVRYVPNGSGPTTQELHEKTLTLAPAEIRVITDALKSIFGLDSGNGAFFLEPESGINATSRTYTRSSAGSFGFGMNAIDIFAATRPRFPVTFSGAFNGSNFRTNLVLTDVSGRGTNVQLFAADIYGALAATDIGFIVDANRQNQASSIAPAFGIPSEGTGALSVQPRSGEAIASLYLIDNRTNDATYFPPDLPAPTVRTIPVIGHVDGANNSQFRSDLYLFNPADSTRTVTLQVQPWDLSAGSTLQLTLLPNEARVIRDVLRNAFGKTGLARLRYQSTTDSSSVRVTSRTYNIDANGGTYGFLMPPLNNFQTAGPGDTLEILGAVGDKNFRTNLGLVELTSFPQQSSANVKVEIVDDAGHTIDSFTTLVPTAGGMQINDLFHNRNLGDGPAAALIRVSPISGMIGAFATIIDNGTNDATYLAAQLGGK
ncbi:MAG TPA: hypothetical protein VJ901_16060 [Thermoanaerobaculia bacterium]|nr:hypothetical protein [Thermoanaerobaculia bacterium]